MQAYDRAVLWHSVRNFLPSLSSMGLFHGPGKRSGSLVEAVGSADQPAAFLLYTSVPLSKEQLLKVFSSVSVL